MNPVRVSVTGFYGTGSSAVIDLLKEYKNAHNVPEVGIPYEHTTFYSAGGLFDLCTLLTKGNAPLQSDYVINNFIDKMKQLNDYDYLWFGSFKKLTGDKFMDSVHEFVDKISVHHKGTNYNHVIKTRFSPVKAILQLVAHIVYKKKFKKYGVGYVYDNKPIYYSNLTSDELYQAVREFTKRYFDIFASPDSELDIYDHLIWPQQVDSHARCFDDNFKIIIVNRDPRDVYISDQFLWCKPPIGRGKPHFDENPLKFIDEWNKTVSPEYHNPNVLRIQFEDLIYNYDETVCQIENFLGLSPSAHINKRKFFIPEKSINNTQVFLRDSKWEGLSVLLAEHLPEFIYNFPYKFEAKKSDVFGTV